MSTGNSYNPYAGFNTSLNPQYSQPFDGCACGGPDACGVAVKPTIKVKAVAKTTAAGTVEHALEVQPHGEVYVNSAHTPFGVWDNHLVANDLNAPKFRKYQPPALPYVCNRGGMGASLCGIGSCNP